MMRQTKRWIRDRKIQDPKKSAIITKVVERPLILQKGWVRDKRFLQVPQGSGN